MDREKRNNADVVADAAVDAADEADDKATSAAPAASMAEIEQNSNIIHNNHEENQLNNIVNPQDDTLSVPLEEQQQQQPATIITTGNIPIIVHDDTIQEQDQQPLIVTKLSATTSTIEKDTNLHYDSDDNNKVNNENNNSNNNNNNCNKNDSSTNLPPTQKITKRGKDQVQSHRRRKRHYRNTAVVVLMETTTPTNERQNTIPIDTNNTKTNSKIHYNSNLQFHQQYRQLPLPTNQYECWLIRRAILPLKSALVSSSGRSGVMSSSSSSQQQNEEVVRVDSSGYTIYGDIALGMKLSIADTGQVIVQQVTSLQDGRASPAQLTGMIQRGDILLAIDNVPLYYPDNNSNNNNNNQNNNNNVLTALKALQAPDDPNIPCQRKYKLRLSAGTGLDLLHAIELQQQQYLGLPGGVTTVSTSTTAATTTTTTKIPSEMLPLFPMVDQLSGMPMLFDNEQPQPFQFDSSKGNSNYNHKTNQSTIDTVPTDIIPISTATGNRSMGRKLSRPLDLYISEDLAYQNHTDRLRYVNIKSNTDTSNEHISNNHSTISSSSKDSTNHHAILSISDMQQQGRKAVMGALNILQCVETVDAGTILDVRSFQSWNTTFSVYSRASIRRHRVFDAASLPSKNNFHTKNVFKEIDEKEEDDEDNDYSNDNDNNSTDSNQNEFDGDELLLRLAAHDEIWRKQVIDFLENIATTTSTNESDHQDNNVENRSNDSPKDINAAISKELGNFLFGENMAKILSTNRTPRTLPQEEVTAVLFDLATKLSASVPDEIKATTGATIITSKSDLTPFKELKHGVPNTDIHLASRFLLDQALPAWLKSFRPLPWEHRRILWPATTRSQIGTGSTAGSTLSDDDGLTVDTTNISLYSTTAATTTTARHHRRKKSIQEIIEDQELDIETRGEACFLVTFYFIHSLLPKLMNSSQQSNPENAQSQIIEFLKEYGSYVRMDTCLAYASVLRATKVIDVLLSIAKHDPRHREAMKQMTKSTSMVFYEPTIMSAVLLQLQGIQKESNIEKKQVVIDLCVAAYPDIRPWQIENACMQNDGNLDSNLYYTYLSHLLHPIDGHDSARRDAKLVKEWCDLSVQVILTGSREDSIQQRSNFLAVASRTSSYHLVYDRDLIFLLKHSMNISEYGLALDLIIEILDDTSLVAMNSTVDLIVKTIRNIAKTSSISDEDRQSSIKILRRVVHIYSKKSFRKLVDVPKEILRLIAHNSEIGHDSLTAGSKSLDFIRFLADETTPDDLLRALILQEQEPKHQSELIPIVQKLLVRGALMGNELSTSLLQIKRARKKLELTESHPKHNNNDDDDGDVQTASMGIWARMGTGSLSIEK